MSQLHMNQVTDDMYGHGPTCFLALARRRQLSHDPHGRHVTPRTSFPSAELAETLLPQQFHTYRSEEHTSELSHSGESRMPSSA